MFLYRTNKGRVVYNRRPKPFRPHDLLRITNKVVESIQVAEVSPMLSGSVILALATVKDRDGSREALWVLGQLLDQQINWISQVMNEDDLNTLQWLLDIFTRGAAQIEDFIKMWSRWRR